MCGGILLGTWKTGNGTLKTLEKRRWKNGQVCQARQVPKWTKALPLWTSIALLRRGAGPLVVLERRGTAVVAEARLVEVWVRAAMLGKALTVGALEAKELTIEAQEAGAPTVEAQGAKDLPVEEQEAKVLTVEAWRGGQLAFWGGVIRTPVTEG
jgi:hypothetical protein